MFKTYVTGIKKTSVARIFYRQNSNDITLNGVSLYKSKDVMHNLMLNRLKDIEKHVDLKFNGFMCTVKGGGVRSQIESCLWGIINIISNNNPETKPILKQMRLLTKDVRQVERKKYGKHKARKSRPYKRR